jgi:hypothetical protein
MSTVSLIGYGSCAQYRRRARITKITRKLVWGVFVFDDGREGGPIKFDRKTGLSTSGFQIPAATLAAL